MRHALWYGHGSFMGLQIHALPTRIENTFPTITFYSLNYRSTLFRIHICQKVQRTALWRKHHFFTCVSIHYLYVYVRLSICSGSALHLLPLYRWRVRIRGIPLHLKSVQRNCRTRTDNLTKPIWRSDRFTVGTYPAGNDISTDITKYVLRDANGYPYGIDRDA